MKQTLTLSLAMLFSTPAVADPAAACRVATFNAEGRPLTEASGTVIATDGRQAVVLTAGHSFFDEHNRPLPVAKVQCYFARQRSLHEASVIDLDPREDLAALVIGAAFDTVCVPVADSEPSEAAPAVFHGHPLGSWKIRTVTAYYRGGWLNAPAVDGDSGAGVIVNGRLVAMVQGTTGTATVCCRCRPILRWLRDRAARRVAWLDGCLSGST